jgi:hypothetical protein
MDLMEPVVGAVASLLAVIIRYSGEANGELLDMLMGAEVGSEDRRSSCPAATLPGP